MKYTDHIPAIESIARQVEVFCMANGYVEPLVFKCPDIEISQRVATTSMIAAREADGFPITVFVNDAKEARVIGYQIPGAMACTTTVTLAPGDVIFFRPEQHRAFDLKDIGVTL